MLRLPLSCSTLTSRAFVWVTLLSVGTLAAPLSAQTTQWARMAPYTDIVWPPTTTDTPQVLLGTEWFDLLSVDGLAVPELIVRARDRWGSDWVKRFEEDLVEVLALMSWTPREVVTLGVRSPTTGVTSTRE